MDKKLNTGQQCALVQLDIKKFLWHNIGQMLVLVGQKSCGISVLKVIQNIEQPALSWPWIEWGKLMSTQLIHRGAFQPELNGDSVISPQWQYILITYKLFPI